MKNTKLLKTNLLVSLILIVGFVLTAVFSYQANYRSSLDNIEQVSALTTEGIYYQLSTTFAKPVNISLAMAHDSLLTDHLEREEEHLSDEEYIETTKTYLENYREKYSYDSVFLVSTDSGRYYNFNGVDRVLKEGDPENVWYFDLLKSDKEYSLAVDNDEVSGAGNEITVFVNCKVKNQEGKVLGVVGVGIRIDHLKDILLEYEEKYNVETSLIGEDGMIQISTTYTGYEKKNWFSVYGKEEVRDQILGWKNSDANLEIWTGSDAQSDGRSYVVARFIPEVSWTLLVEQNTGKMLSEIHNQMYRTFFILTVVMLVVLLVITTVIRNFNRQITELIEERQASFKKATEQLYDNIYELNITRNCYVGKRTEEYFESLGAKGLPYDQGLRVVAQKQIKEEFRDGYVSTFDPENVLREYEMGKNHLRYDFMITQDGVSYHWMRIDAYAFYSPDDESVHMFTYRKNIDAEKRKELEAVTDEMTGLYTKSATERIIGDLLAARQNGMYAFFIFDIDNFKQANDSFGHAFGDHCIREFTSVIRGAFREKDILGRIGGDEFAAFIPIPGDGWVRDKAKELSKALNMVCRKDGVGWKMTASIGVAVCPRDGTEFDELYRHADEALYRTKQNGKSGFSVYSD